GITSAEPVSHAAWFLDLLATAGLAPAEHLTVLTVDGSHLGRFAAGHGLPVRPVHLAGRTGIPGRMSAPTTLVFLLPVALHFAGSGGGQLRAVLREAWRRYDLAGARADPPASSYVRLAAALCAAGHDGRCGLVLSTVEPRPELLAWIEQLLEQSLGKGGKGIVVFTDQSLDDRPAARALRLTVPYPVQADPVLRLAELAAMFLGWQLCTALYGYLHEICVVDEPAVERYKAHARRLLADPEADPLAGLDATPWRHRVIEPGSPQYPDRVRGLAGELRRVAAEQGGYLDITVNGRSPGVRSATIQHWAGVIAGQTLGIPVKLRQAPAAYHISEQSEMDGPQRMVSIRTVSRSHQPARVGTYPDRFLVAAAVASWLAMNEVGRCCFLVLVDEASAVDGVLADLAAAIEQRRV
ncbi:MAG: hypothetical protein J2P15_22755, partial [Micromonosporaceae bacterium]|nr:hypothetical protein [Micromonosporaceae bacterium]